MTDQEQREAARQFYYKWNGKGQEKQDDSSYWIDILTNIFGVENITDRISFQKPVIAGDGNTKWIDVYIPETNVLIEQKSLGIPLDKPQAGHNGKTPYEQAKEYDNYLPFDERARWIITSNFEEIWIYDRNAKKPDPVKLSIADLQSKFHLLDFLVNRETKKVSDEMQVSLQAGEIVGLLYDAFHKQYKNPDDPETLKSLNKLCVRIVFCLYGEDAGIFGKKNMFHDYMEQFDTKTARRGLRNLFRILNQKEDERDPYLVDDDPMLAAFPYVNGGLFSDDNIEIPPFTEEILNLILGKASTGFDWSGISPTIFGAVFESTLNPETRRSGGMHYTSIENIHKVIDPLFLDDLTDEFNSIIYENAKKQSDLRQEYEKQYAEIHKEEADALSIKDQIKRGKKLQEVRAKLKQLQSSRGSVNRRRNASLNTIISELDAFQEKISQLSFLDPACGSGNFLTESYLALRRLENQVILQRQVLGTEISDTKTPIQISFADLNHKESNPIKVSITQFSGIEINDFAVTVARTALWIAENQMLKETEDIIHTKLNFLPLKTAANIVEGNALWNDWEDVVPKEKLNYIMGNPPFVGARYMSPTQKKDVSYIFSGWKNTGDLDYVACWYKKACDMMQDTIIRTALVSTNSLSQGEAVSILWKPLFDEGVHIDFAYRTFIWDSEASIKAHVHCIIIGFSTAPSDNILKIYVDGNVVKADNINGYLLDADSVFIEKRSKPISDVPQIVLGGQAIDDRNYILTEEEKDVLLKSEPQAKDFIRPYMMGRDFIQRIPRYCIWLVGADPATLKKCHQICERIEKVRKFRSESKRTSTLRAAESPALFASIVECTHKYAAWPKVSSQNRRYIPIDYLPADVIPGDELFVMINSELYHFGILMSNVHMAWMRAVCGRLKSDYRYSKRIVYNNFVWPDTTNELRRRVEETAQGILDARAFYPDASLADLYDPLTMPPELKKAHDLNNAAVMKAYGMPIKETTEASCVAWLMRLYQEKVAELEKK